jgi:uncharacterized damage-inducible protein DinB
MNVADVRQLIAFDDWANRRLFAAVAALTDEQLRKSVTSSFSSLWDTLCHIVVEEWVWFRRCQGQNPEVPPSWAVGGNRETVSQALVEVQAEREGFLAELTDAKLDQVIQFRSLEGHEHRHTVRDILIHTVNHSTYHRGQAATILRQLGAAAPETDFVVFREAFQ